MAPVLNTVSLINKGQHYRKESQGVIIAVTFHSIRSRRLAGWNVNTNTSVREELTEHHGSTKDGLNPATDNFLLWLKN